MKLPDMRYTETGTKREVVALRGINYSDSTQEGDLRDCENLSARRYPYLCARRGRVKQESQSGSTTTALTAWGKLVAVQGTNLTYDGAVVGQVTAGEKQFAVVNTKLIIWPDKKYLDLTSKTVKSLGAEAAGTGGTFTATTLTVGSGWPDLTTLFQAGDCVSISGCTAKAGNNLDVVLTGVTATALTAAANSFTATTESGKLKIERKIPDLDYICESENRLWGVSNEKQTIYVSAMGDPTNFFTYEGLSTDSYALAVGSEGDFTGCCKLASSVLFWKETTLHKILGGYPAEYSLYSYSIEGLQKGCHKSMQVINEVLFYKGLHGVYAYSGGTPSLISDNFGQRSFTDAVAGNDGDSYYLSVLEGESRYLFIYETKQGMWLREDGTRVKDFARIGKDLYLLDDGGNVWLADGGGEDKDLTWYAQFAPLYETIQGRKRYSRLLLRLELPEGSYLTAKVKWDGGTVWETVGTLKGKEETTAFLRIPPRRCDKLELRLEGRGPFALLSWLREFRVGSEI